MVEDDDPVIEIVEEDEDPCKMIRNVPWMSNMVHDLGHTIYVPGMPMTTLTYTQPLPAPSPMPIGCTFAETVMTQHTMKKGLELFGEAGVKAILMEMFLKKKHCGRVKGQGCADGQKQCTYINKEDASTPTVAIESVMLTCVIDAAKQCDMATVNKPGMFMQVDMDELVHIWLEGKMFDLLVKIEPKLYHKYIFIEKSKPILYIELKRPCMAPCMQHCCSGKSSVNSWRIGALRSILMIGVLLTKTSMANNAQFSGTLMTSKFHM